jgi:hypothetical protein
MEDHTNMDMFINFQFSMQTEDRVAESAMILLAMEQALDRKSRPLNLVLFSRDLSFALRTLGLSLFLRDPDTYQSNHQ